MNLAMRVLFMILFSLLAWSDECTPDTNASRCPGVSNLLKINLLQIVGPSMGIKVPDMSERLRNVGGNALLG
jgi:hypothetical protein